MLGGPRTTPATASMRASGTGGALDGVHQRALFEVPSGASIELRGTIDNSGTILLNGTNSVADLRLTQGAVLAGGGTINMGTNARSEEHRVELQAPYDIVGSPLLGAENL